MYVKPDTSFAFVNSKTCYIIWRKKTAIRCYKCLKTEYVVRHREIG